MEKTGAQIFIDFLRHHDVDLIFGYPGGAILPIYDELFKSGIKHILTRHEQGAIHAAEGYAKATGKLGVVLATSGPGATNLVTGLADAKMDSVPILAITGQVATPLIGTDAFQEADIYGISIPITKYNNLVRNVNDLASTLELAYIVATSGRPGPVLVDIPKDVQNAKTKNIEFRANPKVADRFENNINKIEGNLDELIEVINKSKKPLLCVGGGAVISGAHKEIEKLVEIANIPVILTLMGLGAFPKNHKLSLGLVGMHGTKYANHAVSHCDLLISLGVRFVDRVTGKVSSFANQAKIAHIDVDIAEIGKIIKVDYPIVGDLKLVLDSILTKIEPQARESWVNHLEERKQKFPMKYKSKSKLIKPQYFIEQLYEKTKGDAIISTDVGQHQMWTAQFYPFSQPRTFLTSGGLGTMGFGFPAALGAKLGCPDRLVVLISGDGSIQMNIQELATAAMYDINVKIVIFNNGFLGMVRQWQELFFDSKFSHTNFHFNPDFVRLAEAYNLNGMKITSDSEVHKGIDFLLSSDKTAILDVMIPEDEKVYPMIPAGGSLDEAIDIDD
ncbi:MAG: biosynthetic-type acetolactate synthase large subunit [Spirochaetota bacterium]|nr:biosynthetic-type acetolactate synthase large subunit [Spirochaetota bacterium]